MEIIPDIKSYDWGKLGADSEVASLAHANDRSFVVDNSRTYAEWWIGDHVSGPSIVKKTGESLSALIARQPELIGATADDGDDEARKLPFLLKVLSIGKALSIQVHPSKEEARILHRDRPDLYKDPNHKPELAIALTPFLALCGFRPHQQLYSTLNELPPLVDLIGADNLEELRTSGEPGLKKCYATLMHSPPDRVDECIRQLSELFESAASANEPNHHSAHTDRGIFRQLQRDFPNDVGSLSLFFLNVLRLQPGEAVFLPAREPHAYLAGNCVECMACSDNVIRAGLTPKFKDVDQLLLQLNYAGASGESKLFAARPADAHTEVFVPAVPDFAVAKIRLSQAADTERPYVFANRRGGSVLLVLDGAAELRVRTADGRVIDGGDDALQLRRGSVVFVPATGTTIALQRQRSGDDDDDDDSDFVAYQAMYNDFE